METTNKLLEASLKYVERGWAVFPLAPKSKRPLEGSSGCLDATTDESTIRKWWTTHPDANVGIACGPSNLVVIDLDGEKGNESWAYSRQKHGFNDDTVLVLTPNGTHLYFAAPESEVRNSAGKLGPGVDVRANGGYVVAPPSVHPSGDTYEWDVGFHPDEYEVAPLPLVILKALYERRKTTADVTGSEIPSGRRDVTLTSLAGTMRRRGMTESEILAALLVTNEERCKPPMIEKEVERIAKSISRYEPMYTNEELPEWDDEPVSAQTEEPKSTTGDKSYLLTEGPDDAGNAECLNKMHAGEFLYCEAYGFLAYDGKCWNKKLAKEQLTRVVISMLKARQHVAVEQGRDSVVRAARPSAYNVRSCIELFKALVSVDVSEFDRSPDYLNCQNGVLDLRAGTMTPHSSPQRFTYCIPVAYDPEADSSEWTKFLSEVLNEEMDVVSYLQDAVGYTLTGHTSEECLFYIFGKERAGKGVFIETLLAMLGREPMAAEVDFRTFASKAGDRDSQNFELAPLKPCRFVAASESAKYQTLNSERIKAVTGGNDIRCAFKHKTHFSYHPQFKIWLTSNFPINADPEDDAMWSRPRVIKFPNSYLGREDKTLKRRMRSPKVLEGVLAWAVKGAIHWSGLGPEGLNTPPSVVDSTKHAREAIDYVGQWIEACVTKIDAEHFVSNEILLASYRQWCANNGVLHPKGMGALTRSLKRREYNAGVSKKVGEKTMRGCKGASLRKLRLQ